MVRLRGRSVRGGRSGALYGVTGAEVRLFDGLLLRARNEGGMRRRLWEGAGYDKKRFGRFGRRGEGGR